MQPIHVERLTRHFGRRVALTDVGLAVHAGEIVGVVGPNGSGKTTLLKILAGFLRADSGRVSVFGKAPYREQSTIMQRARFAFAPPALWGHLTAYEHLAHLAAAHVRGTGRDGALGALRTVGMLERAHDRVRTLSFGMRQRVALALAIVPPPELLVLDEPTEGLDPLAVLELRDVLQRLRQEHGMAILLSSHLLVEIERLVDRLLVLSEGRTLYWGAPQRLTERLERTQLEVSDTERALGQLRAQGYAAEPLDARRIGVRGNGLGLEEARALLHAEGVELLAFHRARPGLEKALLEVLRRGGDGGQS